jgi:hypothetical protein
VLTAEVENRGIGSKVGENNRGFRQRTSSYHKERQVHYNVR